MPPHTVEIIDVLKCVDGRHHTFTQLFHAAPDLTPRLISNRVAELVAGDGTCCRIEQTGAAGTWSLVRGQKEPVWQGWVSPGFRKLVESTVLLYASPAVADSVTFTTRLVLVPANPPVPPP